VNFHKKFPKLCKAISRRRAEFRNQQRRLLRKRLEAVLLEESPPTLRVVAERLGYHQSELRRHCGELVRAISARARKYCKERLHETGYKLEALLTHEPPLTLCEAAARVGHSPGYMRANFPKICGAVSKRYVQHRSRQALARKHDARIMIRNLAIDLFARGNYPSAARVKRTLGVPYVLTPNELCAFLREMREELGL
jgi:methylphosphotriester-DNA--protein-cysteine methyltransferase